MATQAPSAESAKDLDDFLPGYSCPFEPFDDDVFRIAVTEYGRGISRLFVEHNGAAIESQSKALLAFVETWFGGLDVPDAAWDPAFGNIYRALHARPDVETCVELTAALGLHLSACGMAGSWSANLDRELRFRWDDLLLPTTRCLSIESDGKDAEIHLSAEGRNQTLRLKRGDRWSFKNALRLPRLTEQSMNMLFLTKPALDLRDFDELRDKAMPDIDPRMIAVFEDALELIVQYTPAYLPWIRRVLRYAFLVRPRSETIESGSVQHFLGLIHMSAHPDALPVAELMIHEATHQYMNVAIKIQPVDDGTDSRLYYSPPVDKDRPLEMIVAAYHAFANVLIFYRMCRENGLPNQVECDRQESILRPWLDKLAVPLQGNKSLTQVGRALYEPLASRI